MADTMVTAVTKSQMGQGTKGHLKETCKDRSAPRHLDKTLRETPQLSAGATGNRIDKN